jgi:hypothetical protein
VQVMGFVTENSRVEGQFSLVRGVVEPRLPSPEQRTARVQQLRQEAVNIKAANTPATDQDSLTFSGENTSDIDDFDDALRTADRKPKTQPIRK